MKNKKKIAEEILKGGRVVIFMEADACISIKKPKDFVKRINYYDENNDFALKQNLLNFIEKNTYKVLYGVVPKKISSYSNFIVLYGIDDSLKELSSKLQKTSKPKDILNISMINVDKGVSTMETVILNPSNVEGFLNNYEVIYKNFVENCCSNA